MVKFSKIFIKKHIIIIKKTYYMHNYMINNKIR
jgi:hypothetical protein